MNENKLEIEFNFSIEEAVIVGKELTKRSNRMVKYAPYIGFAFLGYLGYYWIISGHYPASNYIPLIFGLLLISIPLLTIFATKKNFKKNPLANKKYQYKFDNNNIEVKIGSIESKLNWNNIIKVEKVKKGYLMFTQPRSAYWIPKSSMSRSSELLFEEFIKNNKVKFK